MKAFITGGAGFIGRELVKQCLQNGFEVIIYDNFSVGPRSNLDEFRNKVTIIEADILDETTLLESLIIHKPEYVFHLAAIHFIPLCNENPTKAFQINVLGTISIIQSISKCDFVRSLIFSSTGAIYNDSDKPLSENEIPTPIDVYGQSKLLAEQVIEFYSKHKFKNTNVGIVRLFNNIGLYETNEHLFPHIVQELKKSYNTVSLGNTKTKRDYISTIDTACGLLKIAVNLNENFDVINLGTSKEYSAEEIIQIFSSKLNRHIKINSEYSRIRSSDKMHQIADITKVNQKYSWYPKCNVEEVIDDLINDAQLK
jgi:UDP-glucose 4-epimerase